MKKWLPLLLVTMLITGCAPGFDKQNEVVQEKDNKEKKSFIPNYEMADTYRSIIPFEPSKARGMVVSNLGSRVDMKEFEEGLLRLAQTQFSPDKYVFQEGQHLDRDTVNAWLRRQYTKEQLKDRKLSEEENIGLNPLNDEKGSVKEQNEKNPLYLAHILEHNFLIKNDQTVKLGGVTIGLALNSVHHYETEQGYDGQYNISRKDLEAEGKKIAEEVIKRLRAMKGLEKVPIQIALFEQKGKNSIVPGNFLSYAVAGEGSDRLGDWKKVNEKYVLFPSSEAEDHHRDDLAYYLRFKEDVDEYFPNYTGVVGLAFYRDDELVDLKMEIPVQIFGSAELIGFTQWATSLVIDHFPDYINVEVSITSLDEPEALIVKKAGEKEPFVHIY